MLNIPGIDPSYFDRDSRAITAKIEIFFDGLHEDPLVVLPSNYLVDFELIEEAGAESNNPLGSVSLNEFSFTLINYDNSFSPTNTQGPYYGKIKIGVIVKAWIKPNIDSIENWIPLGIFRVSDWSCKLGAGMADVACTDMMQDLLRAPIPEMDVLVNSTFKDVFTYVLHQYGYDDTEIEVDELLTGIVQYAFVQFNNTSSYLQCMVEAAIAFISTTRQGKIAVKKFAATTPVSTFTDSDQLMSLNLEQSVVKTYDGVKLKFVLPQLSEVREILTVEELPLLSSRVEHDLILFENPVYVVTGAYILCNDLAYIESYKASVRGIRLVTLLEEADSSVAKIVVSGKNIDLISQEIADTSGNILSVENSYIQSPEYAAEYKTHLEQFVSSDVPSITLNTRGNPLLEIGDTIQVSSQRYKTSFLGIIKRMKFKYNGALSCEMTLMNAEVV